MRIQLFFPAFLLLCMLASPTLAAQNTPASSQPAPPTAPNLSISGNLEICKGSETILKAEGEFESFTWDKNGVKGRLLKVTEEGRYEVTARTKVGCTYTSSVTVRVRPCS